MLFYYISDELWITPFWQVTNVGLIKLMSELYINSKCFGGDLDGD